MTAAKLWACYSVRVSFGAPSILARILPEYSLMFPATLVQRALALSFLPYWEKETPKERFSPISLMSAFNVARSGAIGFFLTFEASLLAAS